jgi:hypothetical protein
VVTFEEIEKADVADIPTRTRVEAFYKGTDALSWFAEEVMIPVLKGQISLTDKEKAIVGTYYRVYAWIRSMVAMNSRIHFQGAAAAARSIFELFLDIKALGTDNSGELVARFHAFAAIERFYAAERLVSFCTSYPGDTKLDYSRQQAFVNEPGKREAIEDTVEKHWGRRKKKKRPRHWTGEEIRERAHDLGLPYEELYYEAYPLLSWYIHSGSAGYAGVDLETIEKCFGLSHSIAQRLFLEATVICAQEMKISRAIEWFHKAVADLRLTSGKVLVEEQIKMLEEAKAKSSGAG